jgi:hypothetical protein
MQVQATGGSYPLDINSPVLLSTHPLTNNAPWWGYFNIFNGLFGVSEMLVDWSTGSPLIQYLTDGTLDFSADLTNGVITNSPAVYDLIPGGSVKSLIVDAASGETQLWGNLSFDNNDTSCHYAYSTSTVNSDTATTATCRMTGGCPTAGGRTVPQNNVPAVNLFAYNNTGPAAPSPLPCGSGFNWWAVSRFTFGASNRVNSSARYMPSGYPNARQSPFRWNSSGGTRYLFSSTADNNVCTDFLFSLFELEYTVESQVQIQ